MKHWAQAFLWLGIVVLAFASSWESCRFTIAGKPYEFGGVRRSGSCCR